MIIRAENAAAEWVEAELVRRRLPGFLLGEERATERDGTRIARRDYAWGAVFQLHAPDRAELTLICVGEVDEGSATVRDPDGTVDTLPLPWRPVAIGVPAAIPEPGGTAPKRGEAPERSEEPISPVPAGPPACLGRFRTQAGCEACLEISRCRGLQRQAIEAGRTIAEHRAIVEVPLPEPPIAAEPTQTARKPRKGKYVPRRKLRVQHGAEARRQRRERIEETMRCLFVDALDVLGLSQADVPERPNMHECWLEERTHGLAAICQTRSGPRVWMFLLGKRRTGAVSIRSRLPVGAPCWGELAPHVYPYVWGRCVSEIRGVGATVSIESMLMVLARAGIEALGIH